MSGTVVHLVTDWRTSALQDALRVDGAAGRDVVIVLLHDAVLDLDLLALRKHARVLVLREDARRRGLPIPEAPAPPEELAPDGAVDYGGLVDLLAMADRVVSW